ncbi:MAG: ATP-binding cassette domain-containing protein [Defluviitaleaceae bacterium]|nr:ATP-binding cassette domain-containing protein [Defluviitaleaceae bacterium]MCL2263909.1 ATP-binding cassette domain-containing protein [Defluviitaleaceae bacterium]
MIEIKNLYKTYDGGGQKVEALKGLNIRIDSGEIFGFIGLSGAGKTSLVRCISALEEVTSGEILIDGEDLANKRGKSLRLLRKKFGLVFQHFNLLMNATVYKNVEFPLKIAKYPKAERHKRVLELLEVVGLSEKKDAYPSKLSGGQKQRVGIARALAADPRFVICDEATSALDPATTTSILHLIKDINKKLGITFIIITHEMSVIKEICTKVAIMEGGKIIESGDVLKLCVWPETETAKRFFKTAEINLSNNAYTLSRQTPGEIIKATFIGLNAPDPYICNIIRQFDVEVAILGGHIQEINETVIGILIIKINGAEKSIADAIKYLDENIEKTEVINYEA